MKLPTILKSAAVGVLVAAGTWYSDRLVKEDAIALRETARVVSELERGLRQVKTLELPGEYTNGFSPEPGSYAEFITYADSANTGLRSPRQILCWQSLEGGSGVAVTQSYRGRESLCPYAPGDVSTAIHKWDQDASFGDAVNLGFAKR